MSNHTKNCFIKTSLFSCLILFCYPETRVMASGIFSPEFIRGATPLMPKVHQVAQGVREKNASDRVNYFLSDALGSVTAITDPNQKVQQTFHFDAFRNSWKFGDMTRNAGHDPISILKLGSCPSISEDRVPEFPRTNVPSPLAGEGQGEGDVIASPPPAGEAPAAPINRGKAPGQAISIDQRDRHALRARDDGFVPIFAGHRYDEATGAYQTPTRFYAPDLGRFTQPDPLSRIPDPTANLLPGPNPFTYVRNNPARYVDPLGLLERERNQQPDPFNAQREPTPQESAGLDLSSALNMATAMVRQEMIRQTGMAGNRNQYFTAAGRRVRVDVKTNDLGQQAYEIWDRHSGDTARGDQLSQVRMVLHVREGEVKALEMQAGTAVGYRDWAATPTTLAWNSGSGWWSAYAPKNSMDLLRSRREVPELNIPGPQPPPEYPLPPQEDFVPGADFESMWRELFGKADQPGYMGPEGIPGRGPAGWTPGMFFPEGGGGAAAPPVPILGRGLAVVAKTNAIAPTLRRGVSQTGIIRAYDTIHVRGGSMTSARERLSHGKKLRKGGLSPITHLIEVFLAHLKKQFLNLALLSIDMAELLAHMLHRVGRQQVLGLCLQAEKIDHLMHMR